MFIAHQIIADLEELVSKDDHRGSSPFTGVFIWPGYGGKEGYTAMDHSLILGRECTGSGYKDWNNKKSPGYFVDMCTILKKDVETKLDPLMLAMLGLQKIGAHVRVKLTGRDISLADFEHQMCKVYMGCMRSRGTRNSGAPKPWRDYCWPSKKEDTVGDHVFESVVCATIVKAYELAITGNQDLEGSWMLPDLEHPFSDI
jgi:hypothetical protein